MGKGEGGDKRGQAEAGRDRAEGVAAGAEMQQGGAGAKGGGRATGGPVQRRRCEGGHGYEEEGAEELERVGSRRRPRGVGG